MIPYNKTDLDRIAIKLLEMQPDPIPRFRIIKNILKYDSGSLEYREAERQIYNTNLIARLNTSQFDDGSWGRFHTQDSSVDSPFPTTEIAVKLALDYGLDKNSILLRRTVDYILDHLDGKLEWSDPAEKHDNPAAWPIETRMYSASILALIDNCHPSLDRYWDYWNTVLSAAFGSGVYNSQVEKTERIRLDNCIRKRPLPFHVKHPLIIITSTRRTLDEELQDRILDFVMNNPQGIYYVYSKRLNDFNAIAARDVFFWLQAQMIIGRFKLWREKSEPALEWIWTKKNKNGLWDFGSGIPRRPMLSFPLSTSWKKGKDRVIDQSVCVLEFLSKYYD